MGADVDDSYANAPAGAAGRVKAELSRLQALYDFALVDNTVFVRGLINAAVDHVVVDSYGVILIGVESHEGASILGTDTGNKWTAAFFNGQVADFSNPLYICTGNENLVRQTLAEDGLALDPGAVRGIILFPGADISHLSLIDASATKIKTTEGLADLFERRSHPSVAVARLSDTEIERVVACVRRYVREIPDQDDSRLRWHDDPAVVASNAEAMMVASPSSHEGNHYRSAGELAGGQAGTMEAPSVRAALLTLGTIVVIVLTVVAGLVFFPRLEAGSTIAWTVTLVVFVGIAELVAANIAAVSRRGRPRLLTGFLGVAVRFVARLAVAFVLVAALWVLVVGGVAQWLGESASARFLPLYSPEVQRTVAPSGPGVVVARNRLRAVAPDVYRAATNLNSPEIAKISAVRTSYTWSYIPTDSPTPERFTIVLDIEGRVVSP